MTVFLIATQEGKLKPILVAMINKYVRCTDFIIAAYWLGQLVVENQ